MCNLQIDDDDDVLMHDIVTATGGELSFSAQLMSAQSFNKQKHVKVDIPETVKEVEDHQIVHALQCSDEETSESSVITIESKEENERKTALPPPPIRKVKTDTPVSHEHTVDAQKIL